ncbi:cellulose synthase interactive 1-like protein [Tanacetum coccineum]
MAAIVGWAYSFGSNGSSHATNDMDRNGDQLRPHDTKPTTPQSLLKMGSSMLMSRLLQSFLQQAPNELTREGKLSNVLGIFNKLGSSRSKNSPSEKLLDMESVLENNEDIEVDSIMEDEEESEDETYIGKSLEEVEHVIGKKRD